MKLLPMIGPDLQSLLHESGIADIWTLARSCNLPPATIFACINDPSFAIFASLSEQEAEQWHRIRERLQKPKNVSR